MTQRFTDLFQVRHPIIQAPMVGVSTPQLAAAVSNAGALGSIGVGASNVKQAKDMIEATRSLTEQPFNVNLFCHATPKRDAAREAAWLEHVRPFFNEFGAHPPKKLVAPYISYLDDPAMHELLLEMRPRVVSFHFGLPSKASIDALKDAGCITLASATGVAEALQVEAAGVDGIVAQGVEAGGHRGQFDGNQESGLGTFALIALIAARTRLPVIAAGGIMNGAGIAAAITLGACGAQMGTAFVPCPESSASDDFRAAFATERAYETTLSSAISGRSARGMRNRLHTDLDRRDASLIPDYPIAYDAVKALNAAALKMKDSSFAVQWAGQGAPLARTLPAAQLVSTLIAEMAPA